MLRKELSLICKHLVSKVQIPDPTMEMHSNKDAVLVCRQVGFFQNLTQLVEHAVKSNDGQPATIVAHSLGCLVSLSFLTGKSADWLKQHVSSLVAISAPWAGSVTALKGVVLTHTIL